MTIRRPPPTPLTEPVTPTPAISKKKPGARRSLSFALDADLWETLGVPISEISLPLTLPTGQTFRWRRTSESPFTGAVGPHLVSLRHIDGDGDGGVEFLLHKPSSSSSSDDRAAAGTALRDFLNLGVSLADLWLGFAAADQGFADLARRLGGGGGGGGARVLRQDPVECLFQFLCSSNNNIRRIERMVAVLSSFGEYLGTVEGHDFHEFPSLERLAMILEEQLREAGFGYRAKYIVGAVKALQAKPNGGAKWLASLRSSDLPEAMDSLCSLPGVGPKVAACIALFSLDHHRAIPVDTHVWQIACRSLTPELRGLRPTPKLCALVASAFATKFGAYAGWAQTALFVGELPSLKSLLGGEEKGVSVSVRKRRRF